MNDTIQLCTFTCQGLLFGLDVLQLREVVSFQPTATVPLASEDIVGLMNLRGQIMPVIDLSRRLQLPETQRENVPTNVIIEGKENPVSILVDRVEDVIEVPIGTIEPPPENLDGLGREHVLGVHRLDDRLVVVLDPASLVEPAAVSTR